jgi:hypothetical protein
MIMVDFQEEFFDSNQKDIETEVGGSEVEIRLTIT